MNDTPDHPLSLASEFPAATREQWLKLVDAVLKGAPFDDKLVSITHDGLRIAPLYQRDAAAMPIAGRPPGMPWQIVQRIDLPDAGASNAEAIHELENGASALSIVLEGSGGAYGFGIDLQDSGLTRLFDGIYLDAGIVVELQLSQRSAGLPQQLAAYVKDRGIAPGSTDIRFGLNPIGGLAGSGRSPAPWPELASRFARIVNDLAGQGFKGPFAIADGRVIHNAGGAEAQELAYVIAVAVAHLRALEREGIAPGAARHMTAFRLSADADQFLTMAKFRALRKLWARIEETCGLTPEPIHVSAETAWRMMSRRDPHVNMLRTTIAVAAAGLGGADAITVLPFTQAIGLPDRFARRIARNTQLILLEESNLARVADPAAGSGGIEDITEQLCVAAWSQFQEIEQAGGPWAALEQGLIQRNVATVRADRMKAVADGREPLIGTTVFPNADEVPVEVLAPAAASSVSSNSVETTALRAMRLSEPFE